jgi:HK97 family phage major capsid protein
MKAYGGISNAAETITTSDGNPLPWVTVDDTANVGEIVAEGGTFAAGADLVFGTANLGAYKYMAGGASNLPLRVSFELLQDSAFDVEGLVSKKLGERIARVQATHLVTGTGSGQPQGITDGLTGVQSAAGSITYPDLITWIHSVDPAYRTGAKWAFNDASLALIRKLVDGENRPLLQPASTASASAAPGGETLLGYPVVIDQAFPTFAANTTTNWGVFGDLAEGFVIRRVKDVVVIANPWTRAANGQVEFSAWARMDSVQQNTNAYVALTGHS